MSIETYAELEQGTEAWRTIRLGLPTASEFHSILAKGEGKTRRSYLMRLAGEILTGEPAETYESADMIRGREMEQEARDLYAFMTDSTPETVGFIKNGDKGCSPDALVGNDGLLEIKTKKPALLVDCILKDTFPAEHKAQCQGALWVAEREWIDIAIYWPRLPLFVKRAYRDEAYIKTLAEAVKAFNDELAATVEQVERFGAPQIGVAA